MRDFSPLILGVLALLTAVVALLWCLGRSQRRVPMCRACGRDVRSFAWREPCVCDCGARLMRRRAVRGQRRRSRGLGAIAVVLFAATILLTWWATQVRANGTGWMDTLPTGLYAYALARGLDEPWHRSASRRLAELPPLEEVAMLRDAALDLWSTESPRSAKSWRLAMQTAAIAVPTGKPGARFIAALLENIDAIAIQQPDGIAVELRPVDPHSGEIRSLMIRVDEVRLGDRAVLFNFVLDEQRLPPDEAARGMRRLWHPLHGSDRSGTLRLLIPGESIEASGPEVVRVIGAAAYASDLLGALLYDDVIATSRDPVAWGVTVASGRLELSGSAPPGRTPPEGVSRAQSWTTRWWPEPRGYPSMPALVGVPVVTMALSGALVGSLLVLALAGARATWRGPMRLSPPTCRGCGALLRGQLRGQQETLPACCPECGRAITSIDDCRCIVRRRRWPLALVVLIVVAAAGVWLMPRAHRWIGSEVRARFASPEQEAAWLVRATLDARPTRVGPSPGNRLTTGFLDSAAKRGWLENPSPNETAARALLAWWRETGGMLPPSTSDPDTSRRRSIVAAFLQQSVARGALSAAEARPTGAWCSDVSLDPPEMSLPRVVRAGEPIKPIPRYTHSTDAVVSVGTDPKAWQWPQSLILATPEVPGTVDVEVTWSRPVLATSQAPPRSGPTALGGPAPAGDPLFERVLRERVHVVPADAPMALTGAVVDELVPTMELALRVREGGTRAAAQLSQQPATWAYLSWQGRWEVLTSDAPDAEPCVVMRRLPTGWSPAALGTLPSPLPEELFLRFVPELPEAAFTSPGKLGFMCGETVTFRLRRSGEEDYEHSRVVVYRTALSE